MSRGGARPNAGRKSIAEEEKTKVKAQAAITGKYGSLEDGLKALLDSEEPSLIKFVYEHALGKPTENIDIKHEEVNGFISLDPLDDTSNDSTQEDSSPKE